MTNIKSAILLLFIGLVQCFPLKMSAQSTETTEYELKLSCVDEAKVDSIFNLEYSITYVNQDYKDLIELKIVPSHNDIAKCLLLSRTSNICNQTGINGNIKCTHQEIWTGLFKGLREGYFETPSLEIHKLSGETFKVDSLIQQIHIKELSTQEIRAKSNQVEIMVEEEQKNPS